MNSCKAFWRPLDASIWRPSDRYGANGWRALAQLYEILNIEYAMICPTVYPSVSSEFFLFLLRFDTCPSKKIVASLGVMHAAARDQSWRNLLSGSLLSGIWTRVQRCSWFCCPDEESNSSICSDLWVFEYLKIFTRRWISQATFPHVNPSFLACFGAHSVIRTTKEAGPLIGAIRRTILHFH